MAIFWQLFAFILVAALILLLVLALIEPGPMQRPHKRGHPGGENAPTGDGQEHSNIDQAGMSSARNSAGTAAENTRTPP
jgi:hypothetical protein